MEGHYPRPAALTERTVQQEVFSVKGRMLKDAVAAVPVGQPCNLATR